MTARATHKTTCQATHKARVEKSAGAVVFFRGVPIEYLLIFSTYWEFPKGLIDPHESPREAALREVREETGLEIRLIPDFQEEIGYFYRRRETGTLVKKQVVYFLGEAPSKEVKLSWEHHQARWASFAEALALLPHENARAILRKAHARVISDENPLH